MQPKATRLLLLLTCNLLFVVVACAQLKSTGDNVAKSCIPRERDALLTFKQGITSNKNNMLTSWRPGQDCCLWRGVTCSVNSGHVIKLDLHNSNDDSWYHSDQVLVGQISPSLLSLEHLEYLDLSRNYYLGGPYNGVPEFFGSMMNLRHLDLSYMNLSGSSLLRFLGNLSRLEYLELTGSFVMREPMPMNVIPEFLGSMKNLRHLGLFFIDLLSGQIPASLGNLSNLEHLDLSNTFISGQIPPSLGNLSNLEHLDLSSTFISGSVPHQLGNLSNLRHLDLNFLQNAYSTSISWLGNLHFLEYLDMSYVNLSATVDWPHALNTVPSLEIIQLQDCLLQSANQSIAYLNLSNLHTLSLSFNHFNHPVASCWFWNLTSIKELYLSETNLYGPFPTALGCMTSLRSLDFGGNHNTAMIEVDLKDLCSLEQLWLAGSLSSRNIAELVEKLPQCPSNKLQDLNLEDNSMTGNLPDQLDHLTSLVYLSLSNNNITGSIPPGIGNCTSLQELFLSNNHLTGAIPLILGNLTILEQLDLSNNQLTGAIPQIVGNLAILEALDLSNNHLTGPIQLEIWNYTSWRYLNISDNLLTELIISDIWTNMSFSMDQLDLSNNHLTKTNLLEIGQYINLSYLDLSNNNLTGSIPRLNGKKFGAHRPQTFSLQTRSRLPPRGEYVRSNGRCRRLAK